MLLRWRDKTTLPVEIDPFTPATIAGRSSLDIANTVARVGNSVAKLGDLFAVQVDDDQRLVLEGNLQPVRAIGRAMSSGTIVIRGDAGPHLGTGMTGGSIIVHGNANDWAGADMRGGLLHIHGNACKSLGASYPGARLGMRDGVILVDGNVGDEAGHKMRRGLIAVGGNAGDGFGRGLIAGSLFAFGSIGRFAGIGMKRGTIAALGPDSPELLSSFALSGRYRFPFVTLYLRRLAEWGFLVTDTMLSAELWRYNGDLTDRGHGEILVLAEPNRR